MPAGPSAERRKLLLKLAAAGIILAIAAVAVLRGADWHAWIAAGLRTVQNAGPWAFFLAMAVTPAFGVPTTTFTLTAGPAFGERLGMGVVVAAACAATTLNLVLAYWLSRGVLRPWLERLLVRLGYRLPEVETGDITDMIILLRTTPGIPFFVQNYLLGLADAPFKRYMLVSCPFSWTSAAVFILFGNALMHGRGWMTFVGVSLIAVLATATHLIRRHWARRAKQPEARPGESRL
jgi:uncharacterized membrane protein YdjX (TVP38/TMEM64 family)